MNDFKPGDYVVGKYNENGSQLEEGQIVGSDKEIEKIQKMFISHADRVGTKLNLESKKTKTKTKPKPKAVSYSAPVVEYSVPAVDLTPKVVETPLNVKTRVYLKSGVGKIRLSVEGVVESDHAFGLVFASEDDVIFEPSPAESLLYIDSYGEEHPVYYPNCLFTWLDGNKKIMVLFKDDQ